MVWFNNAVLHSLKFQWGTINRGVLYKNLRFSVNIAFLKARSWRRSSFFFIRSLQFFFTTDNAVLVPWNSDRFDHDFLPVSHFILETMEDGALRIFSRSQYSSMSNNLKMVQDRAILTMADEQEVINDLSSDDIAGDLQWPLTHSIFSVPMYLRSSWCYIYFLCIVVCFSFEFIILPPLYLSRLCAPWWLLLTVDLTTFFSFLMLIRH